MKVGFKSFGCKVNQYDAARLQARARALGWEPVDARADWDALVVATCAVTGRAETKVRRYVLRAARQGKPVVVYGCAVRLDPPVVNPDETGPDRPLYLARTEDEVALALARLGPDRPAAPHVPPGLRAFPGHARAFLKIGDGCPGGCTYCVVPSLRGPSRSRPLQDLVEEARALAARHSEVVLTAIHLGLWGRDLSPPRKLADLVTGLLALPELGRLRLSSIEAREVDDELLAALAGADRAARHLHGTGLPRQPLPGRPRNAGLDSPRGIVRIRVDGTHRRRNSGSEFRRGHRLRQVGG